GPTECAVYATMWPLPAPFPGGIVPIGRPIANDRIYILDRTGGVQPAPIGVPGELCIAGRGVGAGYLHRPDLTATRFVADPFRAGDAMYRTGDLARWREDGTLEFLGRIDHQVKVRGFRVELGEIETAIGAASEVGECVVVERDGRLVAYVVPARGTPVESIDPEVMKAGLRASLPDYMVPSVIVVLDAMPLNANGKLDRSALPTASILGATRQFVAPRNERETIVAEIWAEVLDRTDLGVEDDFFEIGGHSLLGMRILARLTSRFHRPFPLRMLFEGRTVAGIVAAMDAMEVETEAQELERLLAEIDSVSDDEAMRLLSSNVHHERE
ncbi:MAG: phosphopantetheine-binding protein, partial [bacterium]